MTHSHMHAHVNVTYIPFIKVLRLRVEAALESIEKAQARLGTAKQYLVDSNFRVMQLVSRRKNCLILLQMLDTIAAVNQTQSMLQQLLSAGEYVAGFELIDTAQHILRRDLVGVHSLRQVQRVVCVCRG